MIIPHQPAHPTPATLGCRSVQGVAHYGMTKIGDYIIIPDDAADRIYAFLYDAISGTLGPRIDLGWYGSGIGEASALCHPADVAPDRLILLDGFGTNESYDYVVEFGFGEIENINIRVPDFVRYYQTLSLMIDELAQIAGGAVWGVEPDGRLFFRLRGQDSGFLITHDFESLTTEHWQKSKLCFLRNRAMKHSDSAISHAYTTLIGLGAVHEEIDEDHDDADAQLNLSSRHYAFRIDPEHNNISKIAIALSKTGTLTKSLHVSIVRGDTSGPDETDILQRDVIPASKLNAELADAGKYLEVKFAREPLATSPGDILYVLIEKYPDTSNYPSLDYDSGAGNYYDSATGTTWSQRTGRAKFRTYYSRSIHVIGQNTEARKHSAPKEASLQLTDLPDENSAILTMEGYLESLGKTHREYDPLIVSAPTERPELGKSVRLIDSFNNLDVHADLVAYEISSSVDDVTNLKPVDMTMYLEEWFV